MTFTQKEKSYLKELKEHEELCIEKYSQYAEDACDSQLKSLFMQLSDAEAQHLETLTQISNGTVPTMNQAGQQKKKAQTFKTTYTKNSKDKENDKYLCSDLLSTEKHVSATYNTGIFEFTDPKVRQALNHIQKEEQEHGETLYSYMSANGMYKAK